MKRDKNTAPATTVATALTVYGIETNRLFEDKKVAYQVATALTVYGIETQ